MISGKPVKSAIPRTSIPAASSSRAVPPVETISIPSSLSPRANSTIPVLSDTDHSARATCTSPGLAKWALATASSTAPRLSVDDHATTLDSHHAACDEVDRAGEQLVLDRPQPVVDGLRIGGLGDLHRPLEDHRAAVHAL